jgi:hypothetical protein
VNQVNKDFRIVLKVHYCVYPKWALPFGLLLGYLSTNYNKAFRALFLFTINPESTWAKFSAWNVVFWTKVLIGVGFGGLRFEVLWFGVW